MRRAMTWPAYLEAREAVTAVLGDTREVNGGELESVLTIYTPEGLAVLVLNGLAANGYEVIRTDDPRLREPRSRRSARSPQGANDGG